MKERPILFSSSMVLAILEGRKTQTRRVVKPQPWRNSVGQWLWERRKGEQIPFNPDLNEKLYPQTKLQHVCPYGFPGDRLWVRETWGLYDTEPCDGPARAIVFYRASCDSRHDLLDQLWRPSIYMPRWASRITLEVKEVRVERLQDISEEDSLAEGCPDELGSEYCVDGMSSRKAWYADLWDSINNQRGHGWESNPFVWVIAFHAISDETRAE